MMKKILVGFLIGIILAVYSASVVNAQSTGDYHCSWSDSTKKCNAVSNCQPGYYPDTSVCEEQATGGLCINVVSQSCRPFTNEQSSVTCGSNGTSINTAIGCIPFGDQNALIGFFLKWGLGIGGGIAFLLILAAGFQIMTSRGDPKRLQAGQELMTSAIAGILLLIFSVVILRIIGLDIFNIAAFK